MIVPIVLKNPVVVIQPKLWILENYNPMLRDGDNLNSTALRVELI